MAELEDGLFGHDEIGALTAKQRLAGAMLSKLEHVTSVDNVYILFCKVTDSQNTVQNTLFLADLLREGWMPYRMSTANDKLNARSNDHPSSWTRKDQAEITKDVQGVLFTNMTSHFHCMGASTRSWMDLSAGSS